MIVAAAALALGAWALGGQWVARAEGDLQGQALKPAKDLETGLGLVLGSLLGQKPPAGYIASAVVTGDEPDRLTVVVTVEGDLGGRVLGVLMNENRRVQREVRPAKTRLEGGAHDVALTFEYSGPGPGDAPLQSTYLHVSVDGGVERLFALGKTWGQGSGQSSAGGGEGARVAHVKALPEGRAVTLPAVEPTAGAPGMAVAPLQWNGPTPGVAMRMAPRVAVAPPAPKPVPPPTTATLSQRQAVLSQTASVLRTLPSMTVVQGTFSTNPPPNRGAAGPSAVDAIDVLQDLQDDVGLEAEQLTSFSRLLYRDQNPASGVFYFLPLAYHLDWAADEGRYSMGMTYLAARDKDTTGKVAWAAGLTSGVDASELGLARVLLRERCKRVACGTDDPQVYPYPFDPERLKVNLANTLRLFDIPEKDVAQAETSSDLGAVNVAWVTDPVTKENVQVVLEQSGINGGLTVVAPGGTSGQTVNLRIRLRDPGSFGRARWSRDQDWTNPTPFPVRVKYLHALVTGPDGLPNIYSWSLGSPLLAPGGRMECDARAVPAWLDKKAHRMWISYAVQPDCTSCTEQVVRAITGGVSAVASAQITFSTFTPLAETGAHELSVRVRSRRFDPEGRETTEKSLVLGADGQSFTLGPIYAGDAPGSGSSDVLFEYFLTLTMADGTSYEATRWLPSRDLRVVIGSSQVKQALGTLPGREPSGSDSPVPQP